MTLTYVVWSGSHKMQLIVRSIMKYKTHHKVGYSTNTSVKIMLNAKAVNSKH